MLNTLQIKIKKKIIKFVNNDKKNMLLLGPGGSGKTTTITNAFDSLVKNNKLNPKLVYFCAFTNKATCILRSMIKSNNFNFDTVHKFLKLEPYIKKNKDNDELKFTFDIQNLKDKKIQIVVIDECSIVDTSILNYLNIAQEYYNFKIIYLGDFWQLPPIGEDISPIFKYVSDNKISVYKLKKIMRSNSNIMDTINKELLNYIDMIKNNNINFMRFLEQFPKNILPSFNKIHIKDYNSFINKYNDEKGNKIFITYSNKNCQNINFKIENIISNRKLTYDYKNGIKFIEGDKCIIDRPVETMLYSKKKINKEINDLMKEFGEYIGFDNTDNIIKGKFNNKQLYNGEVFDIIKTKDIRICTPFNKEIYYIYGIKKYMNGQLLTIKDAFDNIYQIVNIDYKEYNKTKYTLRRNLNYSEYSELLASYHKVFPIIDYGYCLTAHKCQGSEFDTVFLNLSSFFYSLRNTKNITQIFKAIYTGFTRAKKNIYVYF